MAEDPAGWIALDANAVTLRIVARPGSSRRGLLRLEPRGLIVAVHAPPDKGRANDELIELLARLVGVPRSAVNLVRGETSRTKTIRIMTSHPREIAAALEALIPKST